MGKKLIVTKMSALTKFPGAAAAWTFSRVGHAVYRRDGIVSKMAAHEQGQEAPAQNKKSLTPRRVLGVFCGDALLPLIDIALLVGGRRC